MMSMTIPKAASMTIGINIPTLEYFFILGTESGGTLPSAAAKQTDTRATVSATALF